jgi:predicted NUDIX family NTP pyrophosphohydrolase
MSGAIVLAYFKKGDVFYIVSAFESSYDKQIPIPIGTANDEEYAELNLDWKGDTKTQYVIDVDTTETEEGRYSIRRKNGIFGFPKGGVKGAETPSTIAVREFGEEVGYTLDESKLKEIGMSGTYTVYTYSVSAEEKEAIDKSSTAMKVERKGELFEVKFRGVADIKGRKLNQKSRVALELFEAKLAQLGGKRTTRKKTMKRKRAKRQTSK